jgi:ABC-2 type transport system permease protein
MSFARSSRSLVRASLLMALRYRGNFFFQLLNVIVVLSWTLVPLIVVFGGRKTIAGFSFDQALLVTAWFTFEKGILDGFIMPSLTRAIEYIRSGKFDFVLLKPIDPQLIASIGNVNFFAMFNIPAAAALLGIALHRLHHVPSLREGVVALVLTLAATAILYSINMLVLSTAFFVARIDNLVYMVSSLFDAGRWPSTVFHGGARILFTFVLPLGLMTTFPALAVVGQLSSEGVWIDLGVAVFALAFSRALFLRAIRSYTSAGG